METPTIILASWNLLITVILGLTSLLYKQYIDKIKEQAAEVQRLNILLNKTREEVARENVTKAEVEKITEHIDQRFNRLEEKIDRLISRS
jgi:hypothetical protein